MECSAEVSEAPAVVAVSVRASDATAYVRLAGEVDFADTIALAGAADQLHAAAPSTVVLDLAAVTFADSTLVNFVVRIYNRMPNGARLLLCRPTPLTRRILAVTSIDTIAVRCENLPPQWDGQFPSPMPGESGARRSGR